MWLLDNLRCYFSMKKESVNVKVLSSEFGVVEPLRELFYSASPVYVFQPQRGMPCVVGNDL